MKSISYLILLISFNSFAQSSDSTYLNSTDSSQRKTVTYFPKMTEHLVVKNNIAFSTTLAPKTQTETEIWDLEEMECKALLKRDSVTLQKLWDRDFTLNAPLNKVVTGKNPLPYYISFTRLVERVSVIDNAVYTWGIESLIPLESHGKPGDPIKRRYGHVWMKKYGVWKLVSKQTYKEEK